MKRLAICFCVASVVLGCGSSGATGSGGAGGGASGGAGASGVGAGTGTGGAGTGGLGAGGAGTGGQAGAIPDYCSACAPPVKTGTLAAPALVELSGLAASAVFPGVFYAENDSGNPASVFAIDKTGADLGEYQLTGTNNIDWEDLARGPCPSGSCIYVGDIGDNAVSRLVYTVYRFAEPASMSPGKHPVDSEALPFIYPDGSHNAETLLVDPVSGEIAIVTKVASGMSHVYVYPLPLTPGVQAVLVEKGALAPPSGSNLFTGGDVHPSSRGVLLRTYSSLFFYAKDAGQTIAHALAGAPCEVPSAAEAQGEAVGWTHSGDGYITSSEGAHAPINSVGCTPP